MDKCPRCFKDISWIEERVRKGRKYYYAVHYEGYSRVDGRVRRRIKKCYLGPRVYEYVQGCIQILDYRFTDLWLGIDSSNISKWSRDAYNTLILGF